jgi:hypothetical protein
VARQLHPHWLAATLLLFALAAAACSRQAATTTAPTLDYEMQRMMVLDDDDLPVEFVHLISYGPETVEQPPEHYTHEERQWVMSTFVEYAEWYTSERREYEEEPLESATHLALDSGNRVFDDADQAAETFENEANWVHDNLAEAEPWYDYVEVFAVSDIGDEAFGLIARRPADDTVAYTRWETQVMFRRGQVLGVVTIRRSAESQDSPIVTELARRLDAKIIAALAGQITPEPADGYSPEAGGLSGLDENPVAPTRQLISFAFHMETTYALAGTPVTTHISGLFHSPDQMRCDIETDPPSDVTTVFSVGGQFAVGNDEDGYRFVESNDPLFAIVYTCPGSDLFFDSLHISELDLGYWDTDTGEYVEPQAVVETVSGVETRKYVTDDVDSTGLQASFEGLEEIQVWFHTEDGWPVRLIMEALIDPDLVAGAGAPTDPDAGRMTLNLEVSRPNDPTITVDVPDQIAPPEPPA